MTDPATIRKTFDAIERERGGYAVADAAKVCEDVAALLNAPLPRVRSVMIDAWAGTGSG